MKKQIKVLILTMVLVLISTLGVNAANTTVSLNSSKTEVEKEETFTVTLNAKCDEGINGLSTTVSYDEEKLELLNSGVGDTEKWFNLGENLKFDIIHHKSGTETSADLLKLTFKVKDTAEVGTKAEVTVSDITLDSDASENSIKEMGTKEIEISIVEKASNNDQGDNTTDNNNKEDVDDNNKDDVNNNKDNADDNKGSATNSKGNTSTEQLNLKGDNTKAEKQLPKTGVYNIIGIILLILASAIIFYNKYNKYKKV